MTDNISPAGDDVSMVDLYQSPPTNTTNRRISPDVEYTDYNTISLEHQFFAKLCNDAYQNTQPPYVYFKRQVADTTIIDDYELVAGINYNYNYSNLAVYRSIEPRATELNQKSYIFVLKGTSNIYDLIADANVLFDYSTSGISNSFISTYSGILLRTYEEIKSYISNNGAYQFVLIGHSLGGKLCLDIYNKLIQENLDNGVYVKIYNPYTIYDSYSKLLLDNLDKALAGEPGYEVYIKLKDDIECIMSRGDYVCALYPIDFPGKLYLYPEVLQSQRYNDLSTISYNIYVESVNHTINNFNNYFNSNNSEHIQSAITDTSDGTLYTFNNSDFSISNRRVLDFTQISNSLGNVHLKLKGDDLQNILLNVFEGLNELPTNQTSEYIWTLSQIIGLHKVFEFDIGQGMRRYITNIYHFENNKNMNTSFNGWFRLEGIDSNMDEYYLLYDTHETGINKNIPLIVQPQLNTSIMRSLLPASSSASNTEGELHNSGIQLNHELESTYNGLSNPNDIRRYLWHLDARSIQPFQDATDSAWEEDDLRRGIHPHVVANDTTYQQFVNSELLLQYDENSSAVVIQPATLTNRYLVLDKHGTQDLYAVIKYSQTITDDMFSRKWYIDNQFTSDVYNKFRVYNHPVINEGDPTEAGNDRFRLGWQNIQCRLRSSDLQSAIYPRLNWATDLIFTRIGQNEYRISYVLSSSDTDINGNDLTPYHGQTITLYWTDFGDSNYPDEIPPFEDQYGTADIVMFDNYPTYLDWGGITRDTFIIRPYDPTIDEQYP